MWRDFSSRGAGAGISTVGQEPLERRNALVVGTGLAAWRERHRRWASRVRVGEITPIESRQPPAVVQLRRDRDGGGSGAIWPLTTISTRRFCGSRTLSPVGTSSWGLALADNGDGLIGHALADHLVLHRVRAAKRQGHIIAVRAGGVGVTGRRDTGVTGGPKGGDRLGDHV